MSRLEIFKPAITPPPVFLKPPPPVQPERPGWIPTHITENWDPDPYAYQTEEEQMPGGGPHGRLLGYIAEVLRTHLEKQHLMLLIDAFLLYRDSQGIKQRVGPDLLLMEHCFPEPAAYDLDQRPPPRCVIEITSPESHDKDLDTNVSLYPALGVEHYLVIDAITPQKVLRNPIELHMWQRTRGKSSRKLRPDSEGYFLLPEMNLKIAARGQGLVFADARTGELLRDSEALGQALDNAVKEKEQAQEKLDALLLRLQEKGISLDDL